MRHGEVFSIWDSIPSDKDKPKDEKLSAEFEALNNTLTSEKWREHCLHKRETFSPIVTYLAQLMAHDVAFSVKFDIQSASPARVRQMRPSNLRTNPLSLDTIYGEGLHLDPQFYVPLDFLGRKPSAEFALNSYDHPEWEQTVTLPAFSLNFQRWGKRNKIPLEHLVPRLADPRNADQPILMQITAEFMSYHNRWVKALRSSNPKRYSAPEVAFQAARALTVLTYHNILLHELGDQVCCRDGTRSIGRPPVGKDTFQGVFRAFHCLALDRYHLQDGAKSETLLRMLAWDTCKPRLKLGKNTASLADAIRASLESWSVDWAIRWDVFLDPDVNKTAFTPSFSAGFGDKPIFEKDRAAAEEHEVSTLGKYRHLSPCVEKLLEDIQNHGSNHKLKPKNLPLHLAFLAEGYCEQESGTLGPTASAAVRQFLDTNIRVVRDKYLGILDQLRLVKLADGLPKNFADMRKSKPKLPSTKGALA
ncbi:hypothetical protein C8N43_3898 [Litoreibacter ponti]|uniref:Uncharacterized protein n=1 Tax=Litoreibacter ponti TaxID=1510457 RepID=A0A2T6BCP6_9RHOB|nr:hypothetical protein [Litoreibacter ponti]PTX53855.1 hypothetical protein C8N43_3898 [Litoreibacter ponti]